MNEMTVNCKECYEEKQQQGAETENYRGESPL